MAIKTNKICANEFKTCRKLSFDCTLNKLDFKVKFKCILLFLISGSSSHRHLCECPSTETSLSGPWEG